MKTIRLLSIAGVAVLAACRGPAGPALVGSWGGFVYLHDEYGAPLANNSGVTVIAIPTANVSTSNNAGAYSFPGLGTGVYSLQYLGTSIGTYSTANLQFVGGGSVVIPPINLGQQSIGVITGLGLTPNAAGDTILATGTITAPPAGATRYVRLFYSLANTIGSNVTLWTATGPLGVHPYPVTTAAFTIVITGQDLQALRNAFAAGSTVYVIGYGESYYENSYPDGNSGKPVFPNVCSLPSNVTTFTMP